MYTYICISKCICILFNQFLSSYLGAISQTQSESPHGHLFPYFRAKHTKQNDYSQGAGQVTRLQALLCSLSSQHLGQAL